VPIALEDVATANRAALRDAFEAAYREHFGAIMPRLAIEAVSWSAAVATEPPPASRAEAARPAPAPQPLGWRRLLDPASGETVDAALYRRAALPLGARIDGPAVIVEDQTSTVIPSACGASIDGLGCIVVERKETSA
jgi:N-methylhydantoinase A